MDRALSIALTGAIVHIVLATLIPCLTKNMKGAKGSIFNRLRLTFMLHRHVLITSTVVAAISIYLAVKVEPEVVSALPEGIINFLK